MNILQLTHSTDLETGGVAKAVRDLSLAFKNLNIDSKAISNSIYESYGCDFIIAHGLWQWPGCLAYKNWQREKRPYLVFPHGMLDPWFKKAYPLKHIKKQLYWCWRQGKILTNAHAVCFTTEEERMLAQKTFWPYKCREVVTGLGVTDPPQSEEEQRIVFEKNFPEIIGKKILLYMGRIHPKKGLSLLLNALSPNSLKDSVVMIAGPIDHNDSYFQKLQRSSTRLCEKVLWTGMLEGNIKWGALRAADALILPSHQENYGMVVAEACSVGTPVFITNKVNLYREILEYDAGIVEDDTQAGVDNLVFGWLNEKHQNMRKNAAKCFHEKLHISNTAKKIMDLFNEIKETSPSPE